MERDYAVRMLAICGVDAIPILEQVLNGEEDDIRLTAVESLLNFDHPRAQMAVFKRLLEDEELRRKAISSPSVMIEECAIRIIEKGTVEEKKKAAALLFDGKLITSLDNERRPTIPILENALDLKREIPLPVRLMAVEALLKLNNIKAHKAVVYALQRDSELKEIAISKCSPRIEKIAAQLMEFGSNPDKCEAAELLISTNTRASRTSLHRAVKREDLIRAIFVINIGERASKEKDPEDRRRIVNSLIKCLRDSRSPEVRFFAAEALREIGGEAGEKAVKALKSMVRIETNSHALDMGIAALEKMGAEIPDGIGISDKKELGEHVTEREGTIAFLLARRISRQAEQDARECASKNTPGRIKRRRDSLHPRAQRQSPLMCIRK